MARRELGPAGLAVAQAVAAAVEPADRTLLIACSDGADSLALAAGAAWVARRRGLAYAAVVVDHGLQPDSAQVAARAREQLDRLGYRHVAVVSVGVDRDSGQGLEAAARAARYAALEAERAARAARLLLGHTLDDQAETVLLGLARGSGLRSLAGMAGSRGIGGGELARPLLGLRRAVTVEACREAGLTPWTDPHNADPGYTRARVRARVLPVLEAELGPGVAEALARTASLARDDADLLDALAADADPGTDELACDLLAGLPVALRRRVLRRWLSRHGVVDLGFEHVLAVEGLVVAWRGQGPIAVPGARVVRVDGCLSCQT